MHSLIKITLAFTLGEIILKSVLYSQWRMQGGALPLRPKHFSIPCSFFLTIWQNYMWVPPLDGPRPVLWGILDLPLTRVLSNTQYLHKV